MFSAVSCLLPLSSSSHQLNNSFGEGRHMGTVLITGASGGIGYELAKLFAKDRHHLVLVARSAEKLTQFAGELQRQFEVKVKPGGFALPEPGAGKVFFDQMQHDETRVNIRVNTGA